VHDGLASQDCCSDQRRPAGLLPQLGCLISAKYKFVFYWLDDDCRTYSRVGLDRELLLILVSLRAGEFLLDFVDELGHECVMDRERGFQSFAPFQSWLLIYNAVHLLRVT
jgi:hypothetical protein